MSVLSLSVLSFGTLNYVLLLEGDEWFNPSKVAGLADTYAANHDNRYNQGQGQRYKPSNGTGMAKSAPYPAKSSGEQSYSQSYGRGRGGHGEQPHSQSRGHRGSYGFRYPLRGIGYPSGNQTERQCFSYICETPGHIAYYCPNRASGGNDKTGNPGTSGRAQVNLYTAAQRVVANDCVVPIGESVYESVWEYGEFLIVETTDECAPTQGKV